MLWEVSRARSRSILSFRKLSRSLSNTSTVAARNSRSSLPTTPARTRFAPSPTGYLHLGSLRTALFNYLLARKTGGQFVLRVEDTDQKRTVPGAIKRLCSDLQWAGLQWDEGPDTKDSPYGPYQQSQRTELYREHAQKLLHSGHAYRCFCSAERLDELARRRQQLGLPTDYDRQCAGIPKDESDSRASSGDKFVIRLLAPDKYPQVNDLVYGAIGKTAGSNTGVTIKHGEIAYEDPVLLKTDGHPTYHLANVVDDHYMDITHVVRATEWISSTPKHLALYEAFGWTPPQFAHVGLLTDEAGHKLSKRNFDTDVAHYRDMGILPSTLINFVALLGWSHEQRSDIMTLEQLVDQFGLHFTKGNTTVTFEKLWFLQKAHAAGAASRQDHELGDMVPRVLSEVRKILSTNTSPENALADGATSDPRPNILEHNSPVLSFLTAAEGESKHHEEYCRGLLLIDAKNYTTPAEFVKRNIYFFIEPPSPDPFVNNSPSTATTEMLMAAMEHLMSLPKTSWTIDALKTRMNEAVKEAAERNDGDNSLGSGAGDRKAIVQRQKAYNKLFHDFIRWVLLNGLEGPSSAPMMALLGREVCLARLQNCQSVLQEAQDAQEESSL